MGSLYATKLFLQLVKAYVSIGHTNALNSELILNRDIQLRFVLASSRLATSHGFVSALRHDHWAFRHGQHLAY